MSYYPNQQQQGYPPYQGNSPVPPQQQGYGQPPNQYPQSNSPYPPNPQQNWNQPPPPNQQYQQPGYAQNQQLQYNAPPPQQNWNQPPPPQQYQQPGYPQQQQQQPYGAPPNQYGQPNAYPPNPQQGWNQPPPAQYPQQGYPPGPPPPGQPPYGAPQGYGAPAQQGFGAPGPIGQPSPGYGHVQTANIDVTNEVEALNRAMKGFGTNEKALIATLSKVDPVRMNTIRMQYPQRHKVELVKALEKETSGDFEKGLVQIARGPLLSDCYNLREAIKGIGTNEAVLNDVLIGRTNADIQSILTAYFQEFKTKLETDLQGDLSAETKRMFTAIVTPNRAEESAPIIPQEIEKDARELQAGMSSMITKNPAQVWSILAKRSDAQIRAISQAYGRIFNDSLERELKSKFTGHMEDALVLIVARANNRALSDAVQMEDAMAGMGTKDTLLIQRVVRAHWNPQHMQQVNMEYRNKYRKDLYRRIEGETRGDYEKLLVACVKV